MAERNEPYNIQYEGCICLNPGPFSTDFSFLVFYPSTRETEFSTVP